MKENGKQVCLQLMYINQLGFNTMPDNMYVVTLHLCPVLGASIENISTLKTNVVNRIFNISC